MYVHMTYTMCMYSVRSQTYRNNGAGHIQKVSWQRVYMKNWLLFTQQRTVLSGLEVKNPRAISAVPKKKASSTNRLLHHRKGQPQLIFPKCPTHLMNAKMKVVKDLAKEMYGRPYFVCANKSMPCAFWMWGNVQPNPPCHHGYPSKQRKVHKEGSNKGRSFLNCPISPQCQYFKWMD